MLSTDEITAVLAATDATAYPYGPYFKILLQTAARRSEVQRMKWDDVNLGRGCLDTADLEVRTAYTSSH